MRIDWKRQLKWWCLATFALGYGAWMLTLNGTPLAEPYSPSPYHRMQAEALLHGQFHLSDSITDIEPGLAWHDGRVQQVWGLGIGLWLTPFQALCTACGWGMFPDRIGLGIAFALLALFAGSTAWRINRGAVSDASSGGVPGGETPPEPADGDVCATSRRGRESLALALGLLWLVLLCPPLWTLARASHLVFEQTALYALVLSLGLLVALVRVVLWGGRWGYLLCCLLGSFAPFIRPTHAIYGLAAIVLASAVVWARRRSWRPIALGLGLWVTSLVLLAWTNAVRFGEPAEFGHRLTVSSQSMVYLTRFGNPFRQASIGEASRELGGMLFLNSDVSPAEAFANELFPGQTKSPRWRRFSFATFDVSYAVLGVLGMVGGPLWFLKRRKDSHAGQAEHYSALAAFLLAWAGLSIVVLAVFYLRYPVIASRYLMDFAPGFMGMALVVHLIASRRWPRASTAVLLCWIVYEIAAGKVSRPDFHAFPPVGTGQEQGVPLENFGGIYTASGHPMQTGIALNGLGWQPESGIAEAVVILAIDSPQEIDLHVSLRRSPPGLGDTYRARIGGTELPLRAVQSNSLDVRVVFDVPEHIQARNREEFLFLSFSAGYDAADRHSERRLRAVRWR